MVDVGNRESWGNYTIMNLNEEQIGAYMDSWMDRVKKECAQKSISITAREDVFKMPNLARSVGGFIGFLGKIASNQVRGYTIEDATNPKDVYYKIHLIPQYENAGTVVNCYCETLYNLEFGNKKVMGEALFNSVSQIVNETFRA